jgi:hypothetical protein
MPVAGFYVFNWWLSNQKTDPYALIPGSAFAVVYTHNFYANWDSLENSNLWKNLQGLPNLALKDQRMHSLYSLFGGKKNAEAFLKDKKILISLHLTSATDFDYLFYIPVFSATDDKAFDDLTKKIASDTSYKVEERQYEDLQIIEITKRADKSSFSYVRYKDLLICSYTAVLIDDVIRVIKGEGQDNFLRSNQKAKTPPHAGSETFIYFNYKNLSGLVSAFSDSTEYFKPLNHFADHSSLDFKIGRKDIKLTGFSTAGENDFLSVFKGQKPQQFNLKSYIPNNTSSLYYFGFDNGTALNESLVKYWKKSDSSVIESRRDLYELYNIDFGSIFSEFGNEIGLSILEPEKRRASGKLLFIKANNPNRFYLHLNKIVTLAKEDRNDTLYNEQYHGYNIKEMNIPQFPRMMLGDLFNGFEKCYYVTIGDCMVFSDDPIHIRRLVENIDSENVWSKTSSINTMLENNFTSSNVSFYLDTEKSWKNIFQHASSDIKIQLQNNMEELKQIHQTLIQYKVVNGRIFTSFIMNHNLDQEILNIDNAYISENIISMERGILSEPYLFSYKGHNEIIVQDSVFPLYSVSEGLVVWSDTLGKGISGPVLSMDLEKKGIHAYLGIAQNIIFAYEQNGVRLDGFPVIFPDSVSLNTLSVMDYDQTKNYKILVSDQKGHLYMFDKKGKPIDGWKPLKLDGRLKHPVKHLRIKGKDILIGLQENGEIWARNNKGEFYKGFPLDLKITSSSPLFIDGEQTSAENTFLTVLSDKGEVIKMDLKGSVLKRESLGNGARTSFKLCPNQVKDSYVILAQSKNELNVLNDKLEQVFDMILNSLDLDLEFYTYSDKSLFVIYDRGANLCYVMDDKGKNIFKSAVKATKPLKISFNGSKVSVVKVYQYQLEEGSVK